MLGQILSSGGENKNIRDFFCINCCCHAGMLMSVKQTLSSLPTQEIFGGQRRTNLQNKKPKYFFNHIGQKVFHFFFH